MSTRRTERARFKCVMGGWWATPRIQCSHRAGRRSVHDGTRFQVASFGALPMLLAGECPSADPSAGWVSAGADAERADAADVQFDNAGTTLHTHSRSAGDSPFA